VFSTISTALSLTTTPIESGAESPGDRVWLKVQVKAWPEALQVQLSPEYPMKLSSAGRVSVTVMGGDATPAAGPFCTVMA
jgi:hypothetical protein